jgi:hypothetical protein
MHLTAAKVARFDLRESWINGALKIEAERLRQFICHHA